MQFGCRERNGEHRSRRKVVDQASAVGDDGERIFKGEDSGETGSDIFSDAVAHHGCGLDAERHPPACKRVLNGEERGLREPGLVQLFGRCVAFLFRRIECRAEIEPERPEKVLCAEIDRVAKDRLVSVEFATHADVLRTLAGEHEDGVGRNFGRYSFGDVKVFATCEGGQFIAGFSDDESTPVCKSVAAELAGEGDVGKIEIGVRVQVSDEIGEAVFSSGFSLCGDRQELIGLGLAQQDRRWCFFKHNVRVCASDA